MADWHEPFTASYRFMRVNRITGYETEQIEGIRANAAHYIALAKQQL